MTLFPFVLFLSALLAVLVLARLQRRVRLCGAPVGKTVLRTARTASASNGFFADILSPDRSLSTTNFGASVFDTAISEILWCLGESDAPGLAVDPAYFATGPAKQSAGIAFRFPLFEPTANHANVKLSAAKTVVDFLTLGGVCEAIDRRERVFLARGRAFLLEKRPLWKPVLTIPFALRRLVLGVTMP